MLFKIIGSSFRHQVNGNARSIGTDECSRATVFLHFSENLLLDIQSLHYYFNDPVGTGNIFHIVSKIAGTDFLHHIFVKNGGWVRFDGCSQCIINNAVAIGWFRIFG